ncbi:MAG: hypothetical protein GX672_08150 [Synergistaceae bacterium]|nr:hypothetical protein [Synergistaceae bacterium]
MKKITLLSLALLMLFFNISLSSAQVTDALPEIEGWINGELRKTEFDTVSGKRGFWLERDYRHTVGVPFHAVWMEGSGDKGWTPPEKEISADDGPLGTGASYKTLYVMGEKAILEHHPVTGYSLSVKVGKKGTLTLESIIATEEEMAAAAEVLVGRIN